MKLSKLFVAACALPSICLAQTERELGSHDHGAGSLNIAIEDNLVIMEFDAPWDNLVGFEHTPTSDDQKKLVQDALMALESPNAFVSFNGTSCEVSSVSIENSMSDEHDDEHDDEHAEKHDDEQAHGKEDKAETHSAVFAAYSFDCRDTSRLESITVSIFDTWERFEELDVQMIGPTGAAAMELMPGNTSVDLTQVN